MLTLGMWSLQDYIRTKFIKKNNIINMNHKYFLLYNIRFFNMEYKVKNIKEQSFNVDNLCEK